MSIKLAVFLGNPGTEYRNTRHNSAWLVADALPNTGTSWQSKFKGTMTQYDPGYAVGNSTGNRVVLLRPETFMNLSGESVRAAMAFFKLVPENLIVVHDEIELPFGTIHVRRGGGLGGHNGLRSISAALGTSSYWRFRIGVGRPIHGNIASYVLSKFSPDEEMYLPRYFPAAAEKLLDALTSAQQPEAAGPIKVLVGQ